MDRRDALKTIGCSPLLLTPAVGLARQVDEKKVVRIKTVVLSTVVGRYKAVPIYVVMTDTFYPNEDGLPVDAPITDCLPNRAWHVYDNYAFFNPPSITSRFSEGREGIPSPAIHWKDYKFIRSKLPTKVIKQLDEFPDLCRGGPRRGGYHEFHMFEGRNSNGS